MFRKIIFISVIVVVMGWFFVWELKAQRAPDPNDMMASISERFQQMEAKMDKFSASLDKAGNRDVLMKLDLVLANQQKIISELEIVKVRASQKR